MIFLKLISADFNVILHLLRHLYMLKLLQYSWAFTALICLSLGIFNFIKLEVFSSEIALLFAVGMGALIIFFVLKRQQKSKKLTPKNEQN